MKNRFSMVNWQFAKTNHQPREEATIKDYTKKLGKVIEINETQIQYHVGELVRGTVEEVPVETYLAGISVRCGKDITEALRALK